MEYQLPIKELKKYSVKFSTLIMLTTFVSTYVVEGALEVVIFRSFFAFLHFYCAFRLNVFLYSCMEKYKMQLRPRMRFVVGALATLGLIILTLNINAYLIRSGFLPTSITENEFSEIMNGKKKYFFIPFISIVIFSTVDFFHRFIILSNATRQSENEVARLKTANLETTNQLLKQQIQPHFLFNALNTLKSLIRKQPDKAEDYLYQLSEFLRASLSVHKYDTVLLKEELLVCENYMEMQKTRFGDALIFDVEISKEDAKLYILPFFALQPLLENAIKHNEFTKLNPLHISISKVGEFIEVRNNLQLRKYVVDSTGNGLSSLKERYRILFQEEVELEQTEEAFIVRLKLFTNENRSN